MTHTTWQSHKNERGMVSFMVTLIMILVISLIVIGFSQITRRNQQELRDRQLSTQAFYAAESAINTATEVIRRTSADSIAAKSNCSTATSDASPYTAGISPVLATDPDVRYTCLLVNPVVPDLRTSADTLSSSVVRIDATDKDTGSSLPLRQLMFRWSNADGDVDGSVGGCATAGTLTRFPKNGAGCGYAVLRADLLIASGNGSTTTNPQSLNNNTYTVYFRPMQSAGSAGVLDQKVTVVGAPCTQAAKQCTARLDLPMDMTGKYIYARLSTLYKNAPAITVDGTVGGVEDSAFFRGQIQIDATGKAQDVLRRVQVRVPNDLSFDSDAPAFAAWSATSVCKQFTAAPGVFADSCP